MTGNLNLKDDNYSGRFEKRLTIDIYLRKSRADEELEKSLGHGETLARHRNILLKLSKERDYIIRNVFEELVSGEELFFRPAMIELLKDVESGNVDGVLVMEVQRLGRGDMEEQGIILKAFKNSNTLIITPQKTYDLNNEIDEEYGEFEAFMSRKEYKMIKKRLQGGRIASVNEGNYIATRPPYGYDILRINKKNRTLKPNPEQEQVVQMIFDWYVNKNMGTGLIANELERMCIKSYTGKSKWDKSHLVNVLKNPVYIGKIVWKKKCIRKSKEPGKKKDTYTRPQEEWIVSDGKHPAIIEDNLYYKAQEILAGKYHVPYQIVNGVTNPLAGIIICDICGSKMVKRPVGSKPPRIMCIKNCGQKSNFFKPVEDLLLTELEEYYSFLILEANTTKKNSENVELTLLEKSIVNLDNELKILEQQRLKTYDLLEQGIYDLSVFTERSNTIQMKINSIVDLIVNSKNQLDQLRSDKTPKQEFIFQLRSVLDAYHKIDNAKDKNILLKSVLSKVTYNKKAEAGVDEFAINIYPKLAHYTTYTT